ncbi:MAG: hypothetical protein CMI18_07725 [Opitutaceae bacterium]|nr:hypothetical protein [Opitutaceae bacterium]
MKWLGIRIVLAGGVAVLLFIFKLEPAVPTLDAQSADSIQFLAIGRQGYLNKETLQIAKAMERIAAELSPHFAILSGDNFYPMGVQSVNDPLWKKKFEKQYKGPHLRGMYFYAVQGKY